MSDFTEKKRCYIIAPTVGEFLRDINDDGESAEIFRSLDAAVQFLVETDFSYTEGREYFQIWECRPTRLSIKTVPVPPGANGRRGRGRRMRPVMSATLKRKLAEMDGED